LPARDTFRPLPVRDAVTAPAISFWESSVCVSDVARKFANAVRRLVLRRASRWDQQRNL